MMYNIRTTTYLLCAFLLMSFMQTQAQTFHAFIVTEDGAPGSNKDKVLMQREVANIARLTGMTARTYVFGRHQRGLASQIRALRASSSDVILFYYSGHGANSGNGWPIYENNGDGYRVRQTKIRELLKAKSARLKITLFDCCNGGRTRVPYRPVAKAKPPLAHVYNLLFKKFSGEVMACASASNKLAYGDNDSGSYFTLGVMDAFTKISLGRNAWRDLADKSITSTNQLCVQAGQNRQTPKFYLNVKYTGPGNGQGGGIRPTAAPDLIIIGQNGHNFNNLYQIVTQFRNDPRHRGITVQKLKAWNKISSVEVRNGQQIRLVRPFTKEIGD